ncbi:hypothetical protein [Microlunatus sp. Gsoil 973]|uniref:DUF7507 domain-containing protein n=1 Tax=Microlunatus sp. Gsoil 973 TaxID=2672569 RepID=UPI001E4BF4FA|nr:hypothetical protein [Microlunatus sp. Gsoil 973]
MTCTAVYATTQADLNAGSITNTATVTGTPPTGADVTDTDQAVVTANQGPDIQIAKNASPGSFGAAGTPITYSYQVTNTGNVTLDDVRVTDPHVGLSAVSCAPAQGSSLDPGDVMTCTAVYTTTQADLNAGSITNTATVTGTPPTGADVTDTDQAVVTANQGPDIQIAKNASPGSFGAAGTPITYSYQVTNTGNVTLNNVRVTDPHDGLSDLACAPNQGTSLDPGDVMTCTAVYTTTQDDLNAGSITDTATATGVSVAGDNVLDSDEALVTASTAPAIDIQKTADPTEFGTAGTPITYTYQVTNTGNVTLDDVRVTDPHVGLSAVSCAPAQGATLEPGDQMDCTAVYTTTQGDLNSGSVTDTATVVGSPPTGSNVTDTDQALITANQGPAIQIAKTVAPDTFGAVGTPITYSYQVTNTGNVTLNDVQVTDPHDGLSTISCSPSQGSSLDPGSAMSCTASYSATQADLNIGSITDTATVVGSPPTGPNVTDSDQALVTATTAPAIDIQKSAEPTEFSAAGTPIAYTFVVTNTGNVTLDNVDVTDPLDGLTPIACDPAQGVSLDPGDQMTCTAGYTTTQADLNRGDIANTATVVGVPPAGPNVSDSDQQLITANQGPEIQITKIADPTEFGSAGTPITYTYRMINTGNVTVDDVRITDPHSGLSAISCAPAQGASLDPGDQMDCTAVYTTTQTDVNRGEIVNTATVTGTSPAGDVTDTDTALVTADQGPNITVTKIADPTEFGSAGTVINYGYLVTNNGNVTLDDVRVTDPQVGLSAVSCAPAQGASLAPGDTMSCTARYTTTQADLNAGLITNIGTVTGTPPTGPAVSDSDDAAVTANQVPAITISKIADPAEFGAAGTPITYTYRVTNTGNVTLDDVRVTDPHVGLSAVSCAPAQGATLEPGDQMDCTAAYTTTQADLNSGSVTNTATVVGQPPTGPNVTDTDQALITANQGPNIQIIKIAEPETFGSAGTPITYSYQVTNTGNVTLDDVRVTDPHVGLSAVSCAPAQGSTLDPGDQMDCIGRYTTTQSDLNAGSVTDTATVTGEPPTGNAVTDSDQALITANQGPAITIQKTANPTEFGAAGTPITYTYQVTNTGNVTLDDVRVTDPHVGLSAVSCAPAQGATLDPGDQMDCTAVYTTTQGDLNSGSVTNTATVVGSPPTGPNVTDTDQALITANQGPAIQITKTAAPDTFGAVGTPITFTYQVTNTGNVTLDDVRVTDPHVGLSAVSCAPAQGSTLDPGDQMDCIGRYTTTQSDLNAGSVTDTATVTGEPPTGPAVTDSDQALITANQGPAITIQKTANPTEFGAAGTPITYTYQVTNTGNVTLDDVRVTDPHVGLSAVSCAPAQGATLEPGDQMDCTAVYTTTQGDLNSGSVTNTATVTGEPPTGNAVTDSDQALITANQGPAITTQKTANPTEFGAAGTPITYTYQVTNTGNVTLDNVRVTDPHAGLSAVSCAPAQGATLEPGDQMDCTGRYTTTQADLNSGSVTNTATVVGAPPTGPLVTDSDSAVVVANQAANIDITKSAFPTEFGAAGTPINYTYQVTNNGNVTLDDVQVVDPHAGLSTIACNPPQRSSLDPGDTMQCTAEYTTTQADLNRGGIVNTATVTGTPPAGTEVTDSDSALVIANQSANINIIKTASPTEFGAAGTPITYTYLVTNNGNVTLDDVLVTDPHDGLSAITCDPAQGARLDPGEEMTCTADYTTTQDDLDAGEIINTGTTSGLPVTTDSTSPRLPAALAAERVSDSDTAIVTADQTPSIAISKSADPTSVDAAGDNIIYSYRVTNNGNVTLHDVRVTDPHQGLSDISCEPAQGSNLEPGEQQVCTASYRTKQADIERGSIENVGTVAALTPNDTTVTASDTAMVSVVEKPTPPPTPTPTPSPPSPTPTCPQPPPATPSPSQPPTPPESPTPPSTSPTPPPPCQPVATPPTSTPAPTSGPANLSGTGINPLVETILGIGAALLLAGAVLLVVHLRRRRI